MPLVADAGPSLFDIEAMESSLVVCVPLEDLRRRCASDPIAGALLHDIAAWTFQRQSRREAELLLMDASKRYQAFLEEFGPLAGRIPLHQVASYIGITNVALSRLHRRRAAIADAQR
jgi:CRP-like cAMP-binding protein